MPPVAPRPGVRGLKPEFGQKSNVLHCRTPPGGAWIETGRFNSSGSGAVSRTPPGGAWIETKGATKSSMVKGRTPPGGAWIETASTIPPSQRLDVAPRPGVRGLKHDSDGYVRQYLGVAPRPGVRGLKPEEGERVQKSGVCRTPPGGAWIETDTMMKIMMRDMSHPARGCVD